MSLKDTISKLKTKIDIIQKTSDDERANLEKKINEMDFSGLPDFNKKAKKLESLKGKKKKPKSKRMLGEEWIKDTKKPVEKRRLRPE